MVLNETIQKQSFKQSLSKSHSQMFFKIGVLKNFATGKHLCWSLFLIKLKKRLQHRCFLVNIAKYLRAAYFIEHLRWLLLSVWWSNCSVLGICRPSLSNQKHNVGWFLLKRFVDLGRLCSLHIISRNHSKTFSLINTHKAKTGFQ